MTVQPLVQQTPIIFDQEDGIVLVIPHTLVHLAVILAPIITVILVPIAAVILVRPIVLILVRPLDITFAPIPDPEALVRNIRTVDQRISRQFSRLTWTWVFNLMSLILVSVTRLYPIQ